MKQHETQRRTRGTGALAISPHLRGKSAVCINLHILAALCFDEHIRSLRCYPICLHLRIILPKETPPICLILSIERIFNDLIGIQHYKLCLSVTHGFDGQFIACIDVLHKSSIALIQVQFSGQSDLCADLSHW